jgi:hypothetical protein
MYTLRNVPPYSRLHASAPSLPLKYEPARTSMARYHIVQQGHSSLLWNGESRGGCRRSAARTRGTRWGCRGQTGPAKTEGLNLRRCVTTRQTKKGRNCHDKKEVMAPLLRDVVSGTCTLETDGCLRTEGPVIVCETFGGYQKDCEMRTGGIDARSTREG